MAVPEGCSVLASVVKDGYDADETIAAITNVGIDEAEKNLKGLGFDSLDVVELSMDAEECQKCIHGIGSSACVLGGIVTQLVERNS